MLWDYGHKWVAEVVHRTAGSDGSLYYCISLEEVTGETPDISENLDFPFYDWCWYNNNTGLGEPNLGKWLGVSHCIGSLMSYWVLVENGTLVSRTTAYKVTNIEAQNDKNKARITALDEAIQERLNNKYHVIVEGGKGETKDWNEHPFGNEPTLEEEFSHMIYNEEVVDADNDFSKNFYDDT